MEKEKLNEFYQALEKLKRSSPQQVEAFMGLVDKVERKGALDTKTKELIALVAGMVKHCEWCIAYHTKGAIDAGATEQEIIEAAWVGALMDGGPGLAHMVLVLKALEEFQAKRRNLFYCFVFNPLENPI